MQQTPAAAAAAPAQPLDPWTPQASGDKASRDSSKTPLVSIMSPENALDKQIRGMQALNIVIAVLQFAFALALILIVRYQLVIWWYVATPVERNGYTYVAGWQFICLAGTRYYQGTCEFAYAWGAVSFFWSFTISFMVCLTMDCCGAGRVVETIYDFMGLAWWIAGTVVLAIRANEANAMGLPQYAARSAMVAMAACSAFLWLVLLLANLVLLRKLELHSGLVKVLGGMFLAGKAYQKFAAQPKQLVPDAPVAATVADAKLATDAFGQNVV